MSNETALLGIVVMCFVWGMGKAIENFLKRNNVYWNNYAQVWRDGGHIQIVPMWLLVALVPAYLYFIGI
jgi:hypothetical protein